MSLDTRSGHLQRILLTGRPMDDTPITETTTDYQHTGWHINHSAIALLCIGSFMHLHWLRKDLVASQWQLSFNNRSDSKVSPYQVRTKGSFLGEPSSVLMVHKVYSNQYYGLGTLSLTGSLHLHDDKCDLTFVSVRNKSLLVPHTSIHAVNVHVTGHSIENPAENSTDRQASGWHTHHRDHHWLSGHWMLHQSQRSCLVLPWVLSCIYTDSTRTW